MGHEPEPQALVGVALQLPDLLDQRLRDIHVQRVKPKDHFP